MKKYTIDAKNRPVGRVATEAALLLMGKNSADYKKNKQPEVSVVIANASRARIHQKKLGKVYTSYSGYPGGLKTETLEAITSMKGYGELFKRAVKGMLPKNKLQARMLKNLTIQE